MQGGACRTQAGDDGHGVGRREEREELQKGGWVREEPTLGSG